MAHRLQPDREQRSRDLLSGRDQHVSLARTGAIAQFGGELEQAIGLARHRRDHHDDPITGVARSDHAIGDRLDSLDRTDRRPTVFLNDQSQRDDPIRPEKREELSIMCGKWASNQTLAERMIRVGALFRYRA